MVSCRRQGVIARQKKFYNIGKAGCYLDCLVKISERFMRSVFSLEAVYDAALAKGWMQEDCWILDPAAIMQYLTGVRWTVRHEEVGYKPVDGDNIIQRWEWKSPNGTQGHFTLPDYDPYGESETRKNGDIVSYRILRRA